MKNLHSIFFFIFPLVLFDYIANQTHKYAFEDWIQPVDPGHDRDGNKKKRPFFKSCKKCDEGAQHRAANEPRNKFKIIHNYIIAWIGHLIYLGAIFGGKVAGSNLVYQEAPYGVSIPFLQNSMVRNSFEFMRRCIHFADSSKKKTPDHPNCNPLFKVQYVMSELQKGLQNA